MSLLELALRTVTGLLLIGANAFFVAVEFALTRLRGLDLDPDEIEEAGLGTAWALTERLEIHLTACQLGISSTSVLLGVVAEPALTRVIEPAVSLVGLEGGSVRAISVIVAVILLNLVHKIWGEQAPTYLGVERPVDVARHLAPALAVWSRITAPIVHLGDGLAKASLRPFGVEITRSWLQADADDDGPPPSGPPGRAELRRRMGELLTRGEVPEDRRKEVLQALRIDEIPAERVMVPVEEIDWLREEDDLDTHLERIGRAGRVRYPVLRRGAAGNDVDTADLAGVLYLPALFAPGEERIGERAVDPLLLSAETSVAEVIDRLQDARQEVAMLTHPGEPERIVGLITISDAFEVIAGDVEDPLDR